MKTIAETTPIVPVIIADIIAEEGHRIDERLDLQSASNHLVEKAEYLFKVNRDFCARIRSAKGREYLYSFMRHWLAAWMLKKGTPRSMLPSSWCNGLPLSK
jgi:hypothetical protein